MKQILPLQSITDLVTKTAGLAIIVFVLQIVSMQDTPAHAAAPEHNSQIFPPQGFCNPSDPNYDPTKNYLLSWDGKTNVQCVQLTPLTCGPNQSIKFDPANLQFKCCGTTTSITPVTGSCQPCAANEQGTNCSYQTTNDCTDPTTVTSIQINTCAPSYAYISGIGAIPCPIGGTITGCYVTVNGVSEFTQTGCTATQTYQCTASGLQP